ncbi:MAG: DegV family protein [Coriobacteriia bacterium]|nr:DegV family protein [Coriobacteriia bacterium]
MPGYVLSCCSTVDIPRESLEKRGIEYVYFNYMLDGVPCKDDFGQTNSPSELYAKMLAGAEAKTSQVSTGDYVDHFEKLLSQGLDVLHITLSSGISGTYNSAVAAQGILAEKYPDRKLVVVDSLCASAGYGMFVDQLADLRDEGLGIDEVAAWAEEHKLELHHWFFSTDLTFFIRGGRISKAAGIMGGLLKICPIMDVEPDGSLAVKEKIRTKQRAIKRDLQLMEELAAGGLDYSGKVFISHSECPEDAQAVADEIEATFKHMNGKVRVSDIGATIGCHTGPGTVALFFWGKSRA